MCGFAVAVGWPEAARTVGRLIAGIVHRGDVTDPVATPAPNVAMCTRRLCIVDRDHAEQPQASFDGSLLVSFNGEIYNYGALRRELEAIGVRFRTDSDTEVLANALRVWGYKAVERLSGMYAFVAYDLKSGEFLAARDPFGIKPLYVLQASDGGFLFCSEIRPLLAAVEKLDVLLLPPGYLLTKKYCVRFKSIVPKPVPPWKKHDSKALDAILAKAVASHLPPDLPLAVLFSGGIDSTLIAHYTRRLRPEAPGYFVGGPTAPDYPFAAAYAETTGFDLRLVEFDPESDAVFDGLDEAVTVSESFEPNLIRGAVCSLAVSKRIHADGFRVALCGEGADELFCGYGVLAKAFRDGGDDARPVREDCLSMMHRISLQRVDRCSMFHQVETRVPFLDPAVAEYALNLEASALVRGPDGAFVDKAPLRSLYDLYPRELPRMIRDRTKTLFSEGSGLDANPADSVWQRRIDEKISDRDFADGKREFAPFNLQTKEELYYMRLLSRTMDVARVPHLTGRAWLTARIPAAAAVA
jgi:asparagine synthase (glutamine-hydrolysing)